MASRPSVIRPAKLMLVGGDGGPADAAERLDGGVERHRPDDVGRAGLLPVGRRGPDHLVQVDQVHRPAAGEERVTRLEQGPWPDEGARAERGVQLVAAEDQVVGAERERAVGGELGGVDRYRHTPLVGRIDDGVQRGEPAGHIGRSGDGQQGRRRSLVQRRADVLHREGPRRGALHVATGGHPAPGQQVGVVLDHGGDHHIGRVESQPVGQLVDGLGGVAAQDGHVGPVGIPPGEGQHRSTGVVRRPPWHGGTGTRRPGGRSNRRAGTRPPAPPPRGGPGWRRPGRARRPDGRCRRGRGRADRRR